MASSNQEVPVHDSLQVAASTGLYRTDEWWKAIVTYRFENSDTDETAMYLWHKDDDWKRKNKYVIKTVEAWEIDRKIIDRCLQTDPSSETTTEFPVSDYYTVATGETVFQDEGWWKAIVNVVEKGSYETDEVMVYVWQQVDGDWRRRQKYTIKSVDDWEEEREIIEDHLEIDGTEVIDSNQSDDPDGEVSKALSRLNGELDTHLSGEFTG